MSSDCHGVKRKLPNDSSFDIASHRRVLLKVDPRLFDQKDDDSDELRFQKAFLKVHHWRACVKRRIFSEIQNHTSLSDNTISVILSYHCLYLLVLSTESRIYFLDVDNDECGLHNNLPSGEMLAEHNPSLHRLVADDCMSLRFDEFNRRTFIPLVYYHGRSVTRLLIAPPESSNVFRPSFGCMVDDLANVLGSNLQQRQFAPTTQQLRDFTDGEVTPQVNQLGLSHSTPRVFIDMVDSPYPVLGFELPTPEPRMLTVFDNHTNEQLPLLTISLKKITDYQLSHAARIRCGMSSAKTISPNQLLIGDIFPLTGNGDRATAEDVFFESCQDGIFSPKELLSRKELCSQIILIHLAIKWSYQLQQLVYSINHSRCTLRSRGRNMSFMRDMQVFNEGFLVYNYKDIYYCTRNNEPFHLIHLEDDGTFCMYNAKTKSITPQAMFKEKTIRKVTACLEYHLFYITLLDEHCERLIQIDGAATDDFNLTIKHLYRKESIDFFATPSLHLL